jgi:hypothetical protein
MRISFADIFASGTNSAEIASMLAKPIHVQVSESFIVTDLDEHPSFPSILSIGDVFSFYRVDNLSFKVTPEKLVDMSVSSISQTRGKRKSDDLFTVIKNICNDVVHFYNPEDHQWSFCSIVKFRIMIMSYLMHSST